MNFENTLDEAIDAFKNITHRPENYLGIQEDVIQPAKDLTKSLYDFMKTEEIPISSAKALPELITRHFDEEQIWQEIELQNDDRWTHFLSNVSKISVLKDLTFPIEFGDKKPLKGLKNGIEVHSNDDSMLENDSDENEAIVIKKKVKKTKKASKRETKEKKMKGSIVDDQFFKLKDLEHFLDVEDKKEMNKHNKSKKSFKSEESSDEDGEEEIDLFENWDSDDEGIEKMDEDVDAKHVKYDDFFGGNSDSNDSEEQSKSVTSTKIESDDLGFDDNIENEGSDDSEIDLGDVTNNSKNKNKNVRFDMKQPSSSSDDDDSGKSDTENKNSSLKINTEDMSEYQLRQQRLKKKIGHLENNLLQEKSWPMKGEVTATSRPQNSLLEEVVDFDMTSRPAPIITEETTQKLQDIIIQRIKDKAWDDVERKIKPIEEVHEFKKQLVLDQEKSKISLAQVYEQEYIKQREALDPDADEKPEEEPKEHVEIKNLMTGLFSKLDALCNFHYTPKLAAPEVKIVSNMPAISMEEVAPVATSDATLLAPEEIRAKTKGDIIGKSERTDTDKKRERRQKKTKQREREKQREKREKVLDKMRPGLGNKYSREKASKLLDKVTKDRNVDKMETLGDGKSLKSSTAFFSQLQDEVTNTVKSKLKIQKKTKNSVTAKQMKL